MISPKQQSDTFHFRRVIRRQIMLERGETCELCGEVAAEHVHEIVNRGRTKRGSEQRFASYDKRLCSFLCQACHDQVHNPELRTVLFNMNIERYGWESVKEAFDLTEVTDIDFPERNEHGPTSQDSPHTD